LWSSGLIIFTTENTTTLQDRVVVCETVQRERKTTAVVAARIIL
jgi:hypothetical protein